MNAVTVTFTLKPKNSRCCYLFVVVEFLHSNPQQSQWLADGPTLRPLGMMAERIIRAASGWIYHWIAAGQPEDSQSVPDCLEPQFGFSGFQSDEMETANDESESISSSG
jgi:hypothetical protein